MRIHELYLKAFGPFTEKTIELMGPNRAGLCVLYGPNEVGKTSALRAIRDLFYGIPAVSSDNFVHPHPRMRVGARIVFEDGEEFDFVRRKGTKGTLLSYPAEHEHRDAVETQTESERLSDLVRAIPANVFDRFYGLDHTELAEGSRTLLETDGALGQALFSAGLGTGNIRSVLVGLTNEAEGLFKPRGSIPRINSLLRELREIEKNITRKSLKPSDWKRAKEAATETERELETLEEQIETSRAELVRLNRIQMMRPTLGRYRIARQQLSDMTESAIRQGFERRELAMDFEKRLREARLGGARARSDLERAAGAIESLESRRETLDLAPILLQARSSIDALGDRIGAYQDELDQLPRREAERERLEEDVQSILGAIGTTDSPGDLAALHLLMARASRIRELADRFIEFGTRLEAAEETLVRADAVKAHWAAELESGLDPPSAVGLRQALERARRLGEIDDRLVAEGRRIEADEEACERMFAGLGRWSGPLDEIDCVALPEAESISEFANRFEETRHKKRTLDSEAQRLAAERRDAQERLSSLRSEGSLPSESERDAQRLARDRTWREIRRIWIDAGESVSGDWTKLDTRIPDRFEAEISNADQIADRLRNEAKRVAQESQLVARIERIDAEFDDLAARQREFAETTRAMQANWQSIWATLELSPGEPVEMRAWLEHLRSLRERVVALRRKQRDWQSLSSMRDFARNTVCEQLALLGKAVEKGAATKRGRVDDVVHRGEEVESRLEAARSRARRNREEYDAAIAAVEDADASRRKCSNALDEVGREFARSVEGLGLGDEPRPREVQDRLDRLTELFAHIRDRDKLTERIAQMRNNVSTFTGAVEELVARCAPGLKGLEPDAAVIRLRELLTHAVEQETTRIAVDGSLEEMRAEHLAANRERITVAETMSALRREAGVEDDEGIDVALNVSRAVVEARRALEAEETKLAEMGQGRPIKELEAEAEDIDPDALPGQIERLTARIREWTKRKDAVAKESGAQREILMGMDGSGQAADLAEEAEAVIASIGFDVRRYVTLTLAREILAGEIERYRKRNQAPVLRRATALFRALTRGAYLEVQSEYDDKDQPQLVVIEAEGQKKNVAALSGGTRDQLFLALRLATLEETLGGSEPMPLIADDILVEFDEERSRATLEVFAELGEKTQILLFSHHAHIAEQARDLGDRAHVIEL